MKISRSNFIASNSEIGFFRDEKTAGIFYDSIQQENTYVASLLLIDSIKKYGWYNLNDIMGIDIPYHGLSLTISSIENILNYRFDDLVVTLSEIHGFNSERGNYLLNDIVKYNPTLDTFHIAQEYNLLTKLAIYAGSKKSQFKDFLIDFSRNATFTDTLSYMVESLILYTFLSSCKDTSIKKEIMIYDNIQRQNHDLLLFTLRYADKVLDVENNSDIISRLNIMKIKDNSAYVDFISRLKGYGKLNSMVELLDIV